MKLSVMKIFLSTIASAAILSAAPSVPPAQKPPCAASLTECPDQGCGTNFDAKLNLRKNTISNDQPAAVHTLTWMKKLDDPENFKQGDDRGELAALGEGQNITVVAYLLAVKLELGGESCNCGLQTKAETDNHLVLVSGTTVQKFPLSGSSSSISQVFASRQLESETAEFTPRVRLSHPNFTHEKLQPLVDATPQKALLVRVTGPLLFDSEHFIKNHLPRINNWEIHPVFKLEICTSGSDCKSASDAGWKSLDDIP
jgi:hypothetical protein